MNMFVNFIKNLFGIENFDETIIGLAKFSRNEVSLQNEAPAKRKTAKQEMTLSQMLKRP